MCLDVVTERRWTKPQYGWKVFRQEDGVLWGEIIQDILLPVGLWLDEVNYRPSYFTKDPDLMLDGTFVRPKFQYPIGWHVYLRKRDAKFWCNSAEYPLNVVRKVEIRQIRVFGSQYGAPVVVCKEINIMKEGKRNVKERVKEFLQKLRGIQKCKK